MVLFSTENDMYLTFIPCRIVSSVGLGLSRFHLCSLFSHPVNKIIPLNLLMNEKRLSSAPPIKACLAIATSKSL